MSLLVNTSQRSNQREIMDDFSLEGEMFRDTLNKLERINRTLGGNTVTINGISKLLRQQKSAQDPITIIDLGCGHGDILRDVAKFGRRNGHQFQLIGIDANPDAIAYAQELSEAYEELSFKTIDIFSEEFKQLEFDIVLCTLFVHHFKNEELEPFLKMLLQKAKKGIVINDLHRHKLAYYLFKIIGLFIRNKMVREDGLTSILRAFKRKDLEKMSENINAKASIQWKWAFRYQWILTQRKKK